ncbi:MAG TPA: RIP metalloprotease RseP, partial [Candidatus Acidoferrum sp.]|nr:RIP metalloprotease RseP [Candidatus Acidoferrum sp.]
MTILAAIVVLGILIFVHELGHFLVAKRSRVGVLKFSLGFGPKLVGVKRGETEYLLSALPLGGYVKMVGEDPTDQSAEAADPSRSFSQKSVGTRARIILAGPLANLVLPVLIFWGVFMIVGQPYSLPIVGPPEADSPAAQAGLQAGDQIDAVNKVRVKRWNDVETAVQASAGKPLDFTLTRDGRTFDVRLTPRAISAPDIFGQETQTWDLGLQPFLPARIGQVIPGQVAEQAGLKSGDRVLAIDGEPAADWYQLAKAIRGNPGKQVRLTVERDGQRFDVEVTPRPTKQQTGSGEEEIGLIGIGPAAESHYERLNPVAALVDGFKETAKLSALIVQGFVKLIEGRISPKMIGGPILIGQMAGEVVQRGTV